MHHPPPKCPILVHLGRDVVQSSCCNLLQFNDLWKRMFTSCRRECTTGCEYVVQARFTTTT